MIPEKCSCKLFWSPNHKPAVEICYKHMLTLTTLIGFESMREDFTLEESFIGFSSKCQQ
jgi:hypothetical protein